jgi:tetratricopeptide (TPR) repeat protein
MVMLCKDHGVPVIFVQPPSNLKDFSPFKSEHGPGLSASENRQTLRQLELAANLIKGGRFSAALASAEEAVGRDPLYAEAHYAKGRALLGLGRHQEAKESFTKAKDLDVCPLRCISALEDQILRVASETGTSLILFKDVVERRCAQSGDRTGIPGNESFLDHVHPSIPLHQLLAELIVEKMVEQGLYKPARILTDQERQSIYGKGMGTFDATYMATKDLTLAKTLHWAGKKEEARVILERVAGVLDDNPEVHKLLGRALLEDGRSSEAIEHYVKAVKLSGDDPQMMFSLAVAYYDAGRKREAKSAYEKLTARKSGPPEASANLAMMCLEEGKAQEALDVVRAALKQNPEADSLAAPYALALAVAGKPSEAIPWMLKAVEAEPGEPKHLYNLAAMYALSGDAPKAMRHLDLAVQRGYADVDKLAADSAFRTLHSTPEFRALIDKIR